MTSPHTTSHAFSVYPIPSSPTPHLSNISTWLPHDIEVNCWSLLKYSLSLLTSSTPDQTEISALSCILHPALYPNPLLSQATSLHYAVEIQPFLSAKILDSGAGHLLPRWLEQSPLRPCAVTQHPSHLCPDPCCPKDSLLRGVTTTPCIRISLTGITPALVSIHLLKDHWTRLSLEFI